MTAWQVYWVMQLDSIGIGLFFFGAAFLAAAGLILKVSEYDEEPAFKPAGICFAIGLLILMGDAFLPSTKTAAAMVVLPAITSESATAAVAPEVRELYDLAKDALKHAAGKDAKKKD